MAHLTKQSIEQGHPIEFHFLIKLKGRTETLTSRQAPLFSRDNVQPTTSREVREFNMRPFRVSSCFAILHFKEKLWANESMLTISGVLADVILHILPR